MFTQAPIDFPKLKQCNLAAGRVYRVEEGTDAGRAYPSITRILGAAPKPGLEAWKKRVGTVEAARVSRAATSRGLNVHRLAEYHLSNQPLPPFTPITAELWNHLRPWLDANISSVVAQEQDVYSARLAAAGRIDLLAYNTADELTVTDIKTANKEKDREEYVLDYYLQTCFYACAVYELTGLKVKKLVLPIVHPGGVQVFTSTPLTHLATLTERIDTYYATYHVSDE